MTVIMSFNGCCEFTLCHASNYAGDRAAGKHTETCHRTRIFEDLDELREKAVHEPFHQVGYSSPFFDQTAIGIVSSSQLGINTLRYGAINELAGTYELGCHLTVSIVIFSVIQVFPFSPALQGVLVNEMERDSLFIQIVGYITPVVTACFYGEHDSSTI